MVVANASVDIPALKSRHPLGDAVEAAGVRLRGRGRVRQGVCPFHDEGREATERLAGLLGRRAAAVTHSDGVSGVAELAVHPQRRSGR